MPSLAKVHLFILLIKSIYSKSYLNLSETEKNILEIKQNKKMLVELVFRLRYQCGLSLRAMEKIGGISKSYLAVIINKNLKE